MNRLKPIRPPFSLSQHFRSFAVLQCLTLALKAKKLYELFTFNFMNSKNFMNFLLCTDARPCNCPYFIILSTDAEPCVSTYFTIFSTDAEPCVPPYIIIFSTDAGPCVSAFITTCLLYELSTL